MKFLHWKTFALVGLAAGVGLAVAIAPPVAPASGVAGVSPGQPSSIAQATTITERRIRQILDAMQTANKQRNADGIVKFMAPNAVIEIDVQTSLGAQTIQLNRAEYRQYLQQSYDLINDYRYRISDLEIKVASDQKSATAAYRLAEELTFQNQRITAISQSSLQFNIVQNQILITSMKASSALNVQ